MKYLYPITVVVCFLLTSCGKEYIIKDDKVYLKGWNEGNGSYERLVEDVDAETFQTIDTDDNTTIGKDRNHVYIDGTTIQHLDPNSIKYLGSYYYTDKDAAYFFGFYSNLNDCKIIGADSETIKVSDEYPWAYDDKHVIYGHYILEANDIGSFTPLSEDWAKTGKEVFYHGKRLNAADAKTFKVIDSRSGKDKNRVYRESYY